MPEQLRPESKDLGETATTILNPEPLSPLPFIRFPLISPLVKDESCII